MTAPADTPAPRPAEDRPWPGMDVAGLRILVTGFGVSGYAIAGLTIVTRTEILGAIIGGLFVVISLSVIIQVTSFKLTGKRVFRMAPLQHHFELKGWNEVTIVVRFWIVAGILAGVGLGLFYLDALPRLAS